MHIRDSVPADLDALVGVWRRAVEATHDFLTTAEVDGFERRLRGELPRAAVRVATGPDDGPLGFRSGRGGDVAMLFVDPVAHGRGIGTALLDDVRAPILTVDVNEENPRARDWYRRRGFVEIGRSETDSDGLAHPLIHLRRVTPP
ncbi:GNAT family N-acetyltransferase [Actinomycetospora termitidis]|uniref:GNAT family N-acetyltransferase n=1 Tax=Actinomycetospora termitidis TaxID=3053470 RepID=A0ABT7MDE9_9PSEU|nr:GNAT family N-acetyltransferase [Actinomycetospora sp. Odt1-22]MDL5158690.1 GNAT family N-acetyltransferase [Actinomycetospora sp. Odt1-22]